MFEELRFSYDQAMHKIKQQNHDPDAIKMLDRKLHSKFMRDFKLKVSTLPEKEHGSARFLIDAIQQDAKKLKTPKQ